MKRCVVSVLIFLVAAVGFAQTYQMDMIEYTAGSGFKTATIVIDFDFKNYFVFEYQWDDLSVTGDEEATGWDALYTLHQESDLFMEYIDYTNINWGMYVEDFEYPGGTKFDYPDDGSLGWAYFLSIDNQNWIQDATVYFRKLTDGGFDAWVWTNHDMDNMWLPIRQPGQAPVPEPASLLLFGFGGLFLKKKSR